MKRKQQKLINRGALGFAIALALVLATVGGATAQEYFGGPRPGSVHPDLYQLFTIINQERADAGEAPLTETALLDTSASAHCSDMVTQDYYAHWNPQGKGPSYWLAQQHIAWQKWGENINYSYDTAQVVAAKFYASPDHKANTLNSAFNQVGLAECSPKDYPNLVVEQFVQTP